MLNFSALTRVFVAVEPVDLRRSFNGLFGCVQQQLQLDPLSGHLFVFPNRARIGVEDDNPMNAASLAADNEMLRGLVASTQHALTATQHTLGSTQQQLGSTQEQLAQWQQANQLLRQKLDALIRRSFGRSSETLDPKQLELILAGLSAPPPATDTEKAAAHTPRGAAPGRERTPSRQPLPEHLPTERVVIEPEEVKLQPEAWKKIGEEVTEELDWEPAQFWRRLFIRPKHVRRDETQTRIENAAAAVVPPSSRGVDASPVVIAPLPPRLIEKGLPGSGLLAQSLFGTAIGYALDRWVALNRYGADGMVERGDLQRAGQLSSSGD